MDTLRTDVPIELDRERRLRYDFAALCRLEEGGVKSRDGFDLAKVGLRELALILWAGLAGEDENLTLSRVIEILGQLERPVDEVLEYVGEKVTEAFELAFTDDAKKKAQAMMSSPGKRSAGSASAASGSPGPSSSP